jgi:hypothetical protein
MIQKFSNISGQKVGVEPKIVETKEQLELESLKSTILGLIDQTLTIRNYGTGYKHDMVTVQIDGKDMFVEALLNFLSEKDNKRAISHLESLKESNKDWVSIDAKISQIEHENDGIKYLNENSSYLEKIKAFLDKYAMSEDFDDILEKQIAKITDFEGAFIRSKVATEMLESERYNYPKNTLRSIANKFMYKAKQLKIN